MRVTAFVIFFSIVLLIYGSINYYIFIRGLQAFPFAGFKTFFVWAFIFLASSYWIGRLLERLWISPLSNFLTWVGAFWLGMMVYFFLAVLLIDLGRLIIHFLPFSSWLAAYSPVLKKTLFFLVVGSVSIVTLVSYLNAITPKVTKLDLHVHKKATGRETLHYAMASDIHMGTLVGPRRTAKLVDMLNNIHPDIILLAGDMVDEDLGPVIRNDLGRSLKRLSAPLGVFAITGNHEYIGGADSAVKYLTEHGITMLRDSVALIDSSFYIAGRNDRDAGRFSGKQRMQLPDLLLQVDKNRPIILMDHQPFNLQQAVDQGIDLQLSGHTHHGQIWPLNLITKAIYEVSMGYKQIGNTHFYVSCGYGGWGPPMRSASRPEVLDITIHFDKIAP